MIHVNRRYSVMDTKSTEELANKLANHSWCLCNGFRRNGLLWLNDSYSEDGAQEFAVIRESDMVVVESITVGWMDEDAIHDCIERLGNGADLDGHGSIDTPTLLAHGDGSCRRCA